jgi:hypothetical protein
MDWKIGIRLGAEQYVQLATVRDPYGAAFIAAEVYPVAGRGSRVAEGAVRTTLRRAFAEWGLPDELQTDGEARLNAQSHDSFPSRFQLWLIGLGVRHQRIRPGVPTDNAEVERAHRTLYDYAFLGNLDKSPSQMQILLQQARCQLNREYPSRAHGCQQRPPLQAHPELLQPKRPFDPAQEAQAFQLARVDAHLAQLLWQRKVGQKGQITLGGAHETYSLGCAFAHQTVTVRFDPQDRHFVASDAHQQEIKRWPARHLSANEILDLPPQVSPAEL